MDTLQDLTTAIGTITDVTERTNAWLHAGAQQTHKGNYSQAVTFIINARDLVANFFELGTGRDYMTSQICYEFARARDTTRAQNAIQYIGDDEIRDTTLARVAVQVSIYNLTTANTIVNLINDTLMKDNAITNVAYERAKLGNLNEALTIADNLSDAQLIPIVKRDVIRYASEVIT